MIRFGPGPRPLNLLEMDSDLAISACLGWACLSPMSSIDELYPCVISTCERVMRNNSHLGEDDITHIVFILGHIVSILRKSDVSGRLVSRLNVVIDIVITVES